MPRNAITLGVVATFDREDVGPLASESYCYVTTTGRVSGEPREIEIWFGLDGSTLYMLSGGRDRSHWVKNLLKTPAVQVRIADRVFDGGARVVDGSDEDALARRLLYEKYAAGYSGDLSDWRDTALPIAVDLDLEGERPAG
jgi:deazaflavin-dependent oxidoreductase (nitroreductase family)